MGATEFTCRRRDGQEFDSSHTLSRRETNRLGPAETLTHDRTIAPDRWGIQSRLLSGRLQSNVSYRFLLILSLSKDAHTSHRWFDRLTMSG